MGDAWPLLLTNSMFMRQQAVHRLFTPSVSYPPGPSAANSIIFDQAENRMHAQNGIMMHAMGVA